MKFSSIHGVWLLDRHSSVLGYGPVVGDRSCVSVFYAGIICRMLHVNDEGYRYLTAPGAHGEHVAVGDSVNITFR